MALPRILQVSDQDRNGKSVIRIRDIHISRIFFHHITDILHTKSVEGLVCFFCHVTVLFYRDGISFGIGDFVAEISFIISGFQGYLPFGGILNFFAGLNGIIQSIGKKGTETDIVNAQQSVYGDVEKTVNLIFQSSVILAVQHSVDNTVLTENTVVYSQFPGKFPEIFLRPMKIPVLDKRINHAQMVFHVMADLSDSLLVFFQFFIVGLLVL